MIEKITKDAVLEAIECVGTAKEAIEPTDTMTDLGFDSLDTVELILTLEETLNINILDDEISKCKTVQDIIDLVESKKGVIFHKN